MVASVERLNLRRQRSPRTTAPVLPVQLSQQRVAVLLNANAKAVTEGLRRQLEQLLPAEDVYYSRSFDDARSIARMVLDRGYQTVLTGGGDGTFVGYVNCLLDEAQGRAGRGSGARSGNAALRLQPAAARLPRIGVLRLGTGNSLANLSHSSADRSGVVDDIQRVRAGLLRTTKPLSLLQHEGKRAPFAGMGVDAAILNDYVRLKSSVKDSKLHFAGVGGLGYFWAIAGRTLPRMVSERGLPNVEVVNLGAPAVQLGPDGKPLGRPIHEGEILYRGPCQLAAAGTVPCYGYNFQIFPFAQKLEGRFHLRLTAMGVPWMLANLSQIWRGQTPKSGMLDFSVEKAAIRFDREMPLQVGGDAEGYRREVVLSMAPERLSLIDFAGQPGEVASA
jgi:diacylglycerol kinase family enzyme